MNIWLCPIKPRSWHKIKNHNIFGFPRHIAKVANEIKPNDLIIIHLLRPINGIVAICKVVSEVYESQKNLWGKDRYPLRVKIEFTPKFLRSSRKTIPLSSLFDIRSHDDEIETTFIFEKIVDFKS